MKHISPAKFNTAATNMKKVATNLHIQFFINPAEIEIKQPTMAITYDDIIKST